MTGADVDTFARCMRVGGVAVFPADTVYGLACEPEAFEAVRRLYALKGRKPDKPAAVMFFDPELALAALPELGQRTARAVARLVPGPVTLLLPNPARRFPLAGGPLPEVLGLRVPELTGSLRPMRELRRPVLQSSANPAGAAEARRLADVAPGIRAGADMLLDGGELPGIPSTVIDLRSHEADGTWQIVRAGALAAEAVQGALA